MKLKDLLNEEKDWHSIVNQWLEDYETRIEGVHEKYDGEFDEDDYFDGPIENEDLVDEHGKLIGCDEFAMTALKNVEFSWPISNVVTADDMSLVIKGSKSHGSAITFKNLKDIPRVESLTIRHAVINSLEGIEHLGAISGFDIELNCGLLRLLKTKVPAKDIDFIIVRPEGASAALKIVKHHMRGDRDIADCMEELMDAGLKEYAKL